MNRPGMKFQVTLAIGWMVATVGVLVGCAQPPKSTIQTDNYNFELGKLFTTDGCTVYRFYDAGHYHYFTKCENSQRVETTTDGSCGKGCTVQDNIPTN